MLYTPAISPSYIGGFTSANFAFYDFFADFPQALLSAGHTKCKVTDFPFKSPYRNETLLIGDSGGFQIAKDKWQANWADASCPIAGKYRNDTLDWLDTNFDWYMTLDLPLSILHEKKHYTAQQIIDGSKINIDYWRQHGDPSKILNVLSGTKNQNETQRWFDEFSPYSDPNKAHYFKGYALGGSCITDFRQTLKTIRRLADKNLLTTGHHLMHCLGVSTIWKAYVLFAIEEVIQERFNPDFLITMDSASPFLIAAYGQIAWPMKMTQQGWVISFQKAKFPNNSEDAGDWLRNELDLEPLAGMFDNITCGSLCNAKGGQTTDGYSRVMRHNLQVYIDGLQILRQIYDDGDQIPPQVLTKDTQIIQKNRLVFDLFEMDTHIPDAKNHLLKVIHAVLDAPTQAAAFTIIDTDKLLKEFRAK